MILFCEDESAVEDGDEVADGAGVQSKSRCRGGEEELSLRQSRALFLDVLGKSAWPNLEVDSSTELQVVCK